MSRVAIVIDSTTNIPIEYVRDYNIQSVPARIIWSGKEYRDGIDIQPDEFFSRLQTTRDMPSTSQATPIDFKEIFENLITKGYDILSVVVSSKISGTISSAMQARSMLPKANIEIIDSLTGSMAVGWPVLKVAQAAKQGASLKECKEIIERSIRNTGVLFMVDTLEFLHRGGRIGSAQRFIGTALNFKPILELVDGSFAGIERVRTRTKALKRLGDLLVERVGNQTPIHLASLHASARERAVDLVENVKDRVNITKSLIAEVSPVVGVHLGPGAAGFVYMADAE
jgi:DegV family protein with EDD domain